MSVANAQIVLSRYQCEPLLAQRGQPGDAVTSLDLGMSETTVHLGDDGVLLPDGSTLDWESIEHIAASENGCFRIEPDEIVHIRVFSETTNWVRTLMPTAGAPTMLASGVPMHRIKGIDPLADTARKVATIAPLAGVVLDTATGLGYTAIAAGKTAERVVTIELDPAAIEIARQNPWSRELFENPRIEQIIGDAFEVIRDFPDGTFSRIIHDPPAMSLGGELYSREMYREMLRVCRPNGRVFHYIGDPDSASGRSITKGVIQRLSEAGFRRIVRRPEAFGVVAHP